MPKLKTDAPTTADEWREQIAKLERSHRAAQRTVDDLTAQRRALALDVQLGDREAREQADKLADEIAEAQQAAQDIADALAGANAKLAEAERQAAADAKGDRARKIRELAKRRQHAAATMARALATFAEAAVELVKDGHALRAASERSSNAGLDSVLVSESIKAAMVDLSQQGMVRNFGWPAPEFRGPLPDLIAGADAGHVKWAQDVLGDAPAEQAA